MLTLRLVHNDWRVFIDERDTGPATATEVALWQQIAAVEARARRAEIEARGWQARYEARGEEVVG